MRDKLKKEILIEVRSILKDYNSELQEELYVIQELVERIEGLARHILYLPKPKLSEREFREEEMSEAERAAFYITELVEAIKDQIYRMHELMGKREKLTKSWISDIEFVVDKYSINDEGLDLG